MLGSLVAIFSLLLEEVGLLPQLLNQIVLLHDLSLKLLELAFISFCLRRLAVGGSEARPSVCGVLEIAAREQKLQLVDGHFRNFFERSTALSDLREEGGIVHCGARRENCLQNLRLDLHCRFQGLQVREKRREL